jgi:hypothetical protein
MQGGIQMGTLWEQLYPILFYYFFMDSMKFFWNVFSEFSTRKSANTFFNTLRLLEDDFYQAQYRQTLINYVNQVSLEKR